MTHETTQIFYDKARLRWRYSKRTIAGITVFLLAVFSIAIVSIVIHPQLPKVNLQQPQTKYRGAPIVASINNSNSQQASFANQPFLPSTRSNSTLADNGNQKMIGFYVNWDDNSLTSLKANINHLDELMPEWLHLNDSSESFIVDDQDRQNLAMDFIGKNRPALQISPLINNFSQEKQDWDSDLLTKMLSDKKSRTQTITNLKNYVQQNNFAGISIDFETVANDQQQNLILFMKELYGVFHPLGLEVSQNVPLDDDSFNLKALSNSVDFLILMAYDEHSIYDSPSGPIASQEWFSKLVAKQIALIGAEKIVVAVGGYGYDWIDGKQTGDEVSFQDSIRIAKESKGIIALDKKSLNPTFDYYDNNNLHHVWFLDATTIFNEMVSVKQSGNVKGYALWRIGSEDPSMWNIYDSKSVLSSDSTKSLETLQYGYDVGYEGTGEILRVTATPQIGKRTLTYDDNSGLITGEEIIDFPSSYVITRWGGSDSKKIALTFDDGPDDNYTPKILDILKKYDAKATFFVIGTNVNSNQNIFKRIVNEGHEIGNHTYTHPNISAISAQQFRLELDATERLFEGIIGRKSLLFRPPYSEDIEPETPDQVQPLVETNALGYYTVGMHIDPNDWAKPGVDQIVNAVVSGAQNGDGNVVLLHDSGGDRQQTVEALPKIIEQLQAQGFQFVTVSDQMGLGRDEIMPKISQKEKFLAQVNAIAFVTVSIFNNFIYAMFIIGIILGTMRFLFVVTLAIIQWAYSRYGQSYKRCKDCGFDVDVIIPAYNEERVICRTVQAILDSTYQNCNIVVVDDGSNDETFLRLQKSFGNNPKVAIYTKENAGKSEALNFGIARSTARIIITLDADTIFRKDTIEKLVRRFVDRRIAAVAGNAKVGNRTNILTRWQALEYITSQNLDRRAFEILNCITVVPGAVGAWRRDALLEAGGFSNSTLAEDADLTFAILKNGHHVAYDDEAIGFTEAPETVKNFIKQRYRWMYGMMQTAWKHRDIFFRPRYKALGFFSIPNLLVFQIFFPLISPIMDLTLLVSILWTLWQRQSHQVDFSTTQSFRQVLLFYAFFTVVDLLTASIPFLLEKKEDWTLLLWMPLQRFFYRQLMYYVAIKAVVSAIRGKLVGWGKFERTATVEENIT